MNDAANHPGAPTDAPTRVRLEGTLDMVRASDANFVLRLADGRDIPGRLVRRTVEALARLLNRQVLVFGTGAIGPAGEIRHVEADGFLPVGPDPDLPPDLPGGSPEEREEMARRLRSVMGTWPGDETDEEIEQALRELS